MDRVLRPIAAAVACLGFWTPAVAGEQWVLIAATTNGWENYRHQADACHAYQTLKAKGISPERIILFLYDDVAHQEYNPIRNKLFNKPDPSGPGWDVYKGCEIDYKGDQVNPSTVLSVMTGEGVGKVLKSTEDDTVFIYMVDHGAPGAIVFPKEDMHKVDLQKALQSMKDKRMFKKLVFYLETCFSGSIFEDMKIPGVYAVSAAKPDESSAAAYCPTDAPTTMDMVNGVELGTCLGDEFSGNWLGDSDKGDTSTESLQAQFLRVQNQTEKSHVMQWGDLSFTSDPVGLFIGGERGASELVQSSGLGQGGLVRVQELDVALAKAAIAGMPSLESTMQKRRRIESAYGRLVAAAYPSDSAKRAAALESKVKPNQAKCEMRARQAMREVCASSFDSADPQVLRYHQVIVNLCADPVLGGDVAEFVKTSMCTEASVLV